jgi:hypothetical protein
MFDDYLLLQSAYYATFLTVPDFVFVRGSGEAFALCTSGLYYHEEHKPWVFPHFRMLLRSNRSRLVHN